MGTGSTGRCRSVEVLGTAWALIPIPWTEQAETWLRKCPPGIYPVEQMRKDAQQGRVALFSVQHNGAEKAVTLLDIRGDTLRILAFAGEIGGIDGVRGYFFAVELLASIMELNQVWLETPRPGIAKWVRECGYEESTKKDDPTFKVFHKSL